MRGQWVWGVIMEFRKAPDMRIMSGWNSCYFDKEMAMRKIKRLNKDCGPKAETAEWVQRASIQRIMYFKGKTVENSFDDYCSICGGQLNADAPLTETHKSSLDKP